MAKDSEAPAQLPERYDQVVERLDDVVKRLEGGKLTLEDSLKAFEEGIRLVRRGEGLLTQAERRIEELLHEDGQDRPAPLEVSTQAPAGPRAQGAARPAPAPQEAPDDDVPF
ncbi:MAG: exodeoxyribonuclease VII small subunit [Myxococcota bacterium]|nr:exodeoxyribonuclease VII small subunit [Myxococcota bacterium]